MLVVISDLHLTDGTTGSTVGASAFRDFCDRLKELAYDASWRDNRAGGKLDPSAPDKYYEPIDGFDLVLLGDVFDIIRSTAWTENGETVRPWYDPAVENWEKRLADKVEEIVDAILINNYESLSVLRELSAETPPLMVAPNNFEFRGETVEIDYSRRHPIKIPAATEDGQPNLNAPYVPIVARIHYMVGNHDWNFVSPGPVYNRIRTKTVEALGLSDNPSKAFPWDMATEDHPRLRQAMLDHDVFLRHGDAYDEFNFAQEANERNLASLGDALVIELVNRFPIEVERAIRESPSFQPAFVDSLKEIANVRPMNSLPAWLNSLIDGYRASGMHKSMQQEVQKVWNELVDNLLSSDFVKRQDTWHPLQSVDKLQMLLKTSKFVSVARSEGLIEFGETASRVITSAVDPYAHEAAREQWLVDGLVRYVVYGHTHAQRVVPLDRVVSAERDDKLIYFNCGTWKRLHEQTIFSGDGTRFVDFLVMSYIAFFKDGERSGRPFETWTGTLATQKQLG